MRVKRTQYPIGQGCFHAGHLEWTVDSSHPSEEFHYVYDCGTSDGSAALQDALLACRSETSHIDALFMSHLDADHVSGIDRLLGSVSVDTVYIPYVSAVAPVLDLLQADLEGAVSASLIEALMDPVSWFGRRGVSRIVRVRSSAIGEPPDATDPEPLGEDDPDEPPSEDPDSRYELSVLKEMAVRLPGESSRRPRLETMESGARVVVNPAHRLPWALVPHVDPAPTARRRLFYRKVRQVLGLAPRQRLRADRLATALRNAGERRRLRKCYEHIVSGGSGPHHNRVSMSLYSGPAEPGSEPRWWGYAAIAYSDH